jgi:hypothetical protein
MPQPTDRYRAVASLFREAGRSEMTTDRATIEELTAAQADLGCRFPDSYTWFQLEFGQVERHALEIYSVRRLDPPARNIVGINLEERREGRPALPPHLIAFTDSGGGDFCCFDTTRFEDGECAIVWWDHEAGDDQQPEAAAPSFLDWIETELRERASEEPGSLLDSLGPLYQSWMREWMKRK